VEAVTVGGARALGRDDLGVLRPGARADLAVFAVEPDDDPYAALVRDGEGACVASVVAGNPAYLQGRETGPLG
jgi:5-methylthioadenosine/S-adenosylhomocysteine deaminase